MNIVTRTLTVSLVYRRTLPDDQYMLAGISYGWKSKSSRLKAPWIDNPIIITSNIPKDIGWKPKTR